MMKYIILSAAMTIVILDSTVPGLAHGDPTSILKTEDLQNTTVSANDDLSRLTGERDVAGQQIDPEQLKKMLEELQAVKQTMEERNRLLDQMMNE